MSAGDGGAWEFIAEARDGGNALRNWTKQDVDARQKKSKHGAFNTGRRWEEHELETLQRTDLSLAEKALALGRTYDSVNTQCSQMRREGTL